VKRTAETLLLQMSVLSVVRFTDSAANASLPSDESLGYFQSSAKRGLAGKKFLCKVVTEE